MLGLILLLQALTIAVSGPPTSPEYLPVHVAKAEGYFAHEGLDVTLRRERDETRAADALVNGSADVTATSLDAALRRAGGPGGPAHLIFGLTAAPPLALLVRPADSARLNAVRDLAGLRIGLSAPGSSDHDWLLALLERARLRASQTNVVGLGHRGLPTALDRGDVMAALVAEPTASRLIREGRSTVVADLRSPAAVTAALGRRTVNAGLFVPTVRSLGDDELAAIIRALLAAERRIATASPEALAEHLPPDVVGLPDDFGPRLEASRGLYLPEGRLSVEDVAATLELVLRRLPLPATMALPRAAKLLYLEPLRRALAETPGK